jgi:glyoxylase I family protein
MTMAAKAGTVVDIAKPETIGPLRAHRWARRRANKIRRLHHHAVRTDDMEATRRFYEDLIGMPMVAALKGNVDPSTGRATPFLHCFFEMGDGGSLAFFQFMPEVYGPMTNLPRNGIDHHIAVSVADFADLAAIKSTLDAEGYRNCGINHGFCYSLYVRDPNNMLLEFVADAENELELNENAAALAHDELAKWNRRDFSGGDVAPVTVEYPLPTSPAEDILKVVLDQPRDRVVTQA